MPNGVSSPGPVTPHHGSAGHDLVQLGEHMLQLWSEMLPVKPVPETVAPTPEPPIQPEPTPAGPPPAWGGAALNALPQYSCPVTDPESPPETAARVTGLGQWLDNRVCGQPIAGPSEAPPEPPS